MLVGFLKMQNGLNAFCGEFKRELNVSRYGKLDLYNISALM